MLMLGKELSPPGASEQEAWWVPLTSERTASSEVI